MKIIRSRGTSFTTFEGTSEGRPTRGLRPFAATDGDIQPSKLTDHLKTDDILSMRQVISALDKVIKKPKKLKYCPLEVYVDRTLLSEELWKLFSKKINAAEKEKLRKTWNSKVHPYAKVECDFTMPNEDANGRKTIKSPNVEAGDKTRDDFKGRWHEAHWKLNALEKPNYPAIAKAIFDHLHIEEMKIGKGARKRKSDDKFGLNDARSKSIVASANDPRLGKAASHRELKFDRVVKNYFENDVAEIIRSGAIAAVRNGDPWRGSDFGRLLFENFKSLETDLKPKPLSDDQIKTEDAKWALHSKVRTFYQKIARSEKFQRAVKGGNFEKIAQILPKNAEALLTQINVRQTNAATSELIRLGKLIVHASDLPANPDTEKLNEEFHKRLDYFATSDGQSEIKRNEAFTRVWRNAVGQTTQTLRAWVDPDSIIWNPNRDDDADFLGSLAVSRSVHKGLQAQLSVSHLAAHAKLIFGSKACVGSKARTQIVLSENLLEQKEIVWTLLRIAGEIRNRTNHFNTRKRLQALLVDGVVKAPVTLPDIGNRGSFETDAPSLRRLQDLLQFDISLQKQVIVDGLNRIKVTSYLTKYQQNQVISQMSEDNAAPEIVTPKFIKLLRHTHNIAKNHLEDSSNPIAPFSKLDLVALGSQGRDAQPSADNPAVVRPDLDPVNECRLGLLRGLYTSGFEKWLAGHKLENLKIAIEHAKSAVKFRKDQFETENEQYYKSVDDPSAELQTALPDDVNLTEPALNKLVDLLNALLAQSAALDNAHTTYQSDSEKQKRQTDRFGKFKLDLFGSLFAQYLKNENLTWIWEIMHPIAEAAQTPLLTVENIGTISWPKTTEQWQANFYAWLYLVPTDQVALLRHQFRKTAALENKSMGPVDSESMNQFKTIDRLMALHVAVHEAGFSGDEHYYDKKLKRTMYQQIEDFDKVYSSDEDNHKVSFPGTRRGLRQLQRFGHYNILKSTFEKHKITSAEVNRFTKVDTTKVQGYLVERKEALDAINTAPKNLSALKPDEKAKAETYLREWSTHYNRNVTALMIHKFVANGARLTEFANLHHLMMRVIGRLLDFTLLWERDSQYYFLGLLYHNLSTRDGGFAENCRLNHTRTGNKITLILPAELTWVPIDRNGHNLAPANILPLWHDRFGFSLPPPIAIECLLNNADRAQFSHWFIEAQGQEGKDAARAEKKPQPKAHRGFIKSRAQIRNDFAHYNVINGKKNRINLTYLTNAVRSLFGYDRKLKNAVSNAIADIVAEEGLVIQWEMHNGRLKNPAVWPSVERHLTMIKGPLGAQLQFGLPQASVRYTSMVKALFDFDSGGHRELVSGKIKKGDPIVEAIGPLRYPQGFKDQHSEFVPAPFFEIGYPAYKK